MIFSLIIIIEVIPTGPEGFNLFYDWLRSAFADLRYKVEELIAEGDKVVTRWTWTCTHTGNYNDIPPSGKNIVITGIAVYRIENLKIVERWVELDLQGLMQQLQSVTVEAE